MKGKELAECILGRIVEKSNKHTLPSIDEDTLGKEKKKRERLKDDSAGPPVMTRADRAILSTPTYSNGTTGAGA